MRTISVYEWKKGDVVLIDKNFNTLVDPREERVSASLSFKLVKVSLV